MIDDFGARTPKKPAAKLKTKTFEEQPTPAEPVFMTPEVVAAHDVPLTSSHASSLKPQGSGHHWFNLPWAPSRTEVIFSAIVLVLVTAGATGLITLRQPKATTASKSTIVKSTPKAVAQPATVASTLSGLAVSPAVNQAPVTGVMIENSIDARPQAGLSQAGVVFEAIAEAGITRFLAIYQGQQPTNVGPVRSARPYYLQWDLGFDAPLGHVGGSADALADIKSWNVKDLNQFYNGSAYHRITTREAPHNVYTSISTLNQLETSKGYTTSSFSGFVRKADSPAKQPTAAAINLTLSSSTYNVSYAYNAASNSYLRSEAGAPQVDSNTGQQLSPKVVIAIVTPLSRGALDASGAYYSVYNVLGSGTAYVFQDGQVTIGTWTKPSATSQISFTTSSGQALALDAGQTWISAVASGSAVSYH